MRPLRSRNTLPVFQTPAHSASNSKHVPSVRIKRKVKIGGIWTFATIAKKGDHYLWGQVLIDGQPKKATGGSFFLEWLQEGRKIQKSLRTLDPVAALDAKSAQENLLALWVQGIAHDIEHPALSGEKALQETFATFLDESKHRLAAKSLAKYRNALNRFALLSTKRYATQVTRDDIVRHMNLLQDEGLAAGTAFDHGVIIVDVCRRAGARIDMLKGDWPKDVVKEVEVFDLGDLKTLFACANESEAVLFKTFLLSGFRDQEVQHLAWSDVDLRHGMLKVTSKPEHGFKPKNRQERSVPVSEGLMNLLKEHRTRSRKHAFFVFETQYLNDSKPGGAPDGKMLAKLKKLALRAELNCGNCKSTYKGKPATCKKAPICEKWYLHRFRSTFITELLRSGVDLSTVQALAGHKDIAMTAKYLRPLEGKRLHDALKITTLAGL
jgi:integrase/recombinase XerD